MSKSENRRFQLGHRDVHEAGHVVIAEVLGWPQNGATIDPAKATPLPDGSTAGGEAFIKGIHQWKRGDGPKRKVAAVCARVLYAGRAAELAIIGKDCGGHDRDYVHARAVIDWGRNGCYPMNRERKDGTWVSLGRSPEEIVENIITQTERHLEKQAAKLVAQHKMAIAMVADSLRIKETLTGDDVRALMEEAKRLYPPGCGLVACT